jgi:hypothetical protein
MHTQIAQNRKFSVIVQAIAMKNSDSYISQRAILVLFVGLTVLSLFTVPLNAQDKNDVPASFKVPDGYMQVPMDEFRGVMMLAPKKAVGMFVTYPGDNETTAALRDRVLAFVAPMFIHEEEGKVAPPIRWETKPLASHPGDGDGKAVAHMYVGPAEEMQVAIFERTTGPRPLLYGYFAMLHKSGKGDDGKFLDEQGQGVKAFDKLWKSFTN